jgi:hypothetical protein
VTAVPELSSSILNVTGTPTLILADSSGRVLDFWVGKLSREEEQQVIAAVERK